MFKSQLTQLGEMIAELNMSITNLEETLKNKKRGTS